MHGEPCLLRESSKHCPTAWISSIFFAIVSYSLLMRFTYTFSAWERAGLLNKKPSEAWRFLGTNRLWFHSRSWHVPGFQT